MGKNTPHIGFLLIIFIGAFVTNVNSYSKYGRSCNDIGCLPTEVCTIAHESCNFGQRDGKECGSYPTCTKSGSSNTGSRNNGGQLAPRTPSNPFNPPYIFGHQPTYYNPQATTRTPSSLGYSYNKQDRSYRNSATTTTTKINGNNHYYNIIKNCIISITSSFMFTLILTFNYHRYTNILS